MALSTRRGILTAGAILAGALAPRKPWAARGLPDLADVLVPVEPPMPPPEGIFLDAEGGEHRVSAFLGRGMVVNFWATWCQPCVAEMPSLAVLAKALAPHDIAVLTVSSDRGGAGVVSAWFEQHGVTGLPVLLDPRGVLARAWGARGIPTTHVIDREGRERARISGAADWSTPATVALVRRLVER